MIVGVDASRNRSGGAVAHIDGVLSGADPRLFGIDKVHLWAYAELLEHLPNRDWLVKHAPSVTSSGIIKQLFWQRFELPRIARHLGCQVMFNTDAGSVCRFRPCITLSQDMLSFEPGEIRRFGFGRARLRLLILKYVQAASLRNADVAVFLTNYAAQVIQKSIGNVRRHVVVPHGIGDEFRVADRRSRSNDEGAIRLLYVSNAAMYKHQWHVVQAAAELRSRGYDVYLELVGGGRGPAQRRLEAAINEFDPRRLFVRQLAFVPHRDLPAILRSADVFVFASSCENLPITLLEAMASGLPIACSNRGPMPEVLGDAGCYFDPESPSSIISALEQLLHDRDTQSELSGRAKARAAGFTWSNCSEHTWSLLSQVANA